MDRYLDEQLAKLATDHIDFYLVHGLNKAWWENLSNLGVLEFLDEAVADGRIRYPAFSFHDALPVFKDIVDAYDWTFAQIQYNFMDEEYQAGTEGLRYAAARNLGHSSVMEPLRGGLLSRDPSRNAGDSSKRHRSGALPQNGALPGSGTTPKSPPPSPACLRCSSSKRTSLYAEQRACRFVYPERLRRYPAGKRGVRNPRKDPLHRLAGTVCPARMAWISPGASSPTTRRTCTMQRKECGGVYTWVLSGAIDWHPRDMHPAASPAANARRSARRASRSWST